MDRAGASFRMTALDGARRRDFFHPVIHGTMHVVAVFIP
jgi:hypothetical protein